MMVTATVYRGNSIGASTIFRNGVIADGSSVATFQIQIGAIHYDEWIEVQTTNQSWGLGDYVSFSFTNFTQVCIITRQRFINNNSMRIILQESPWDTACVNAMVDVLGVVARTHLNGTRGLNIPLLQGEPFPHYQQSRSSLQLSTPVQSGLNNLTGGSPADVTPYFVLLVSNRIVDDPRNSYDVWHLNPTINTGIHDLDTDPLPTCAFSSYPHSGGHLAGFPLVFSTRANLQTFVNNLMKSGLKTMRKLNPDTMFVDYRDEAGTVMNTIEDGEDLEMTTLYSANDILGVLYIPPNFCQETVQPVQSVVTLPLDSDYGKLNTYPYRHYTYISRSGEEIHIIPHNNTAVLGTDTLSRTFPLQHRFIGGMNPYVITTSNQGESVTEYVFDCLSYSVDGFTSSLTQLMSTTQRQFTNVRASIATNSGWRMATGAIGAGLGLAKVTGGLSLAAGVAAAAVGAVTSGIRDQVRANQQETDTLLNASTASINQLNASPSITSGSPSFIEKLTPNVIMSNGCNEGDLQAFSSALDTFGETVNGFGSLRGGGTWGGATMRIFSGQYLEFNSISRITNCPARLQAEIAAMFMNGVFII